MCIIVCLSVDLLVKRDYYIYFFFAFVVPWFPQVTFYFIVIIFNFCKTISVKLAQRF